MTSFANSDSSISVKLQEKNESGCKHAPFDWLLCETDLWKVGKRWKWKDSNEQGNTNVTWRLDFRDPFQIRSDWRFAHRALDPPYKQTTRAQCRSSPEKLIRYLTDPVWFRIHLEDEKRSLIRYRSWWRVGTNWWVFKFATNLRPRNSNACA